MTFASAQRCRSSKSCCRAARPSSPARTSGAEGQVVEKYSVEPVRRRLNELCRDVELLENLRSPGEEANDPAFGASLVEASTTTSTKPSVRHTGLTRRSWCRHARASAAGPNLRRETTTILEILESPARPFVAILGGAKVATNWRSRRCSARRPTPSSSVVEWLHLRSFARAQHRLFTL